MREPLSPDSECYEGKPTLRINAADGEDISGYDLATTPEKKRKRPLMPKVFAAALTAFTVFVLLDTFIIARVQGEVQAADLSSITASAASSASADSTSTGKAAGQNGDAEESTGAGESTTSASDDAEEATADEADGETHGKARSRHESGPHRKKPGSESSDESGSSDNDASAKRDSAAEGSAASGTSDEAENTNASEPDSANSLATAASSTLQATDMSYSDENIQVSISTLRAYDTNIYIADVQVSSAEYLKTALAQNAFGRNLKDSTSNIAEDAGAILAINGDYYGFRDDGYVLRNGVLYREQAAAGTDALVIYGDGTMASASQDEATAEELKEAGAWQVLSFGPTLLEDGQIAVDQNDEVDRAMASNPRTAIGMISPLHYIFVVSDGRTDKSTGLSLNQLAQVMEQAGATYAYNLDGGGSSTLWFNGQVVNTPSSGHRDGEREVSDIVYIG